MARLLDTQAMDGMSLPGEVISRSVTFVEANSRIVNGIVLLIDEYEELSGKRLQVGVAGAERTLAT